MNNYLYNGISQKICAIAAALHAAISRALWSLVVGAARAPTSHAAAAHVTHTALAGATASQYHFCPASLALVQTVAWHIFLDRPRHSSHSQLQERCLLCIMQVPAFADIVLHKYALPDIFYTKLGSPNIFHYTGQVYMISIIVVSSGIIKHSPNVIDKMIEERFLSIIASFSHA